MNQSVLKPFPARNDKGELNQLRAKGNIPVSSTAAVRPLPMCS